MKDLGACLRHPGEPALFRCRQCHDAVCVGCRAPDERDLCGTCAQYRSESATREARVLAGEAPDEAPRRIPWGRYAIALLVTLDLGLAGYLVLAGRSDTAITQGVKAVNAVARAVQESRDPAGRYPESLAPVLPRLPEPVAEMIRAGAIQYETYDNRTDYTVSFVLGPRRSSR
jgi:hypothetical protein